MKSWSILALAVAAAMVAGPALAQSAGGGATPQTEKSPAPSDKSGSTGSPATSPSPSGDAPKPGAAKSDTMKSDPKSGTMKSDTMKSDTMKSAGGTGNREQVKSAQEALKQKGFDPGEADGMMGPKTRAALKDFQKKEKLNETGRLDAETMSKLGVQAKADGAAPAASPKTDGGSASPKAPSKPGGEPSDTEKKSPASPAPSGAPKKQSP